VWRINSDVLPQEWGDRYGLTELPRVGPHRSLVALVDGRKDSLVAEAKRVERESEGFIFDHVRSFKRTGTGASPVALVSSPYLRAALGAFGSPPAANARIHEITEALGLRVRIGHPSDTVYLSNNDNDPTLPIVWWNPDRFDLPLPPIADPNPDYADRMEH
jgi:hypothetical protein